MIDQIGITTDGRRLIGGIWAFRETHGLPLDMICMLLRDKGWQPSWTHLYDDMVASGVKDPMAQIIEAANAIGQKEPVQAGLTLYVESKSNE
jgi:hypothetical protein